MVLYGRALQEVALSRPAGVWCLSDVWSWQILLQKSAIAMVKLRHRFSGTVFLSRLI
jgi:hypothetical protein